MTSAPVSKQPNKDLAVVASITEQNDGGLEISFYRSLFSVQFGKSLPRQQRPFSKNILHLKKIS